MRRENSKRKKLRKWNKTTKTRIAVAVLACVLLAGVSVTVYSKYYKTGYNRGMATASGFYFSSDYLVSTESIRGKSMEEIAKNYQQDISISANDDSWKGENAYTHKVHIRNYDNQLLYNDKDLNVDYEVSFMLLEDQTGVATYTVSHDGVTYNLGWDRGKAPIATFKGHLKGGTLVEDEYNLSVSMQNANQYEPVGVLIVARPTGPSYLQNTKWIAGILKVNYQEREFRIEKAGFTISNNVGWENLEEPEDPEEPIEPGIAPWRIEVEKEAGYVYQLYTTGSYTGVGTRKTLELRWKQDMFKINNFDPYYTEVKKDASRYYEETDEDGVKWRVMKIDVLPYASLKFVFYRNDGFDDELDAMVMKEDFEGSVKVTVIN